MDGPAIGTRVAIDFAQGDPLSEPWLSGLDGVDFTHGRIGAGQWGTHAEYCVSHALSVIPLPEGLSFETAAAGMIGLGTAWHMTVALGRVQAGQTVLVNAAGSVVGSSAIQVALLHGAQVIASAGSAAKLEKARELGAAETIDYTRQSIRDEAPRLTDGPRRRSRDRERGRRRAAPEHRRGLLQRPPRHLRSACGRGSAAQRDRALPAST